MRRTRHVVLPVRSWQYIGLLLVSLACLTLGLVSRDREGHSGSLAGPELEHRAPHETDACPNTNPLAELLPSCPITVPEDTAKSINDRKVEIAGSKVPIVSRRSVISRSLSLDRSSRIGVREAGERSSRNRDLRAIDRSRTRVSDNVSVNGQRESRFRRIAGSRDAARSIESTSRLSRSRDLSDRATDRRSYERRSRDLERTNYRSEDRRSRSTERREMNGIAHRLNRDDRSTDRRNALDTQRRTNDYRDRRSFSAERRALSETDRQESREVSAGRRDSRDLARSADRRSSEIRERRSRSVERRESDAIVRRSIERRDAERSSRREDRERLLDRSARIARRDTDRNDNRNRERFSRTPPLPDRYASRERGFSIARNTAIIRNNELVRSNDRRSLSGSTERLSVNDLARERLNRQARSVGANVERSGDRRSSSESRLSARSTERREIDRADRNRKIETRVRDRRSHVRAASPIPPESLRRERNVRSRGIVDHRNTAIDENPRASLARETRSRYDLEETARRERKERVARFSRSLDRDSMDRRETSRIRVPGDHVDRRSRDTSERRDSERRERTNRSYRSRDERGVVSQRSRSLERDSPRRVPEGTADRRVSRERILAGTRAGVSLRRIDLDSARLDSRRSSERSIDERSRSRGGSRMADRRLERNTELRVSRGGIMEERSAPDARRSSERRIDVSSRSREGSRTVDRRPARSTELRVSRERMLEKGAALESRRSSDRRIDESSRSRDGSRTVDRRLARSTELRVSRERMLEKGAALESRRSSDRRIDESSRSRDGSRTQDRRLERSSELRDSISARMTERNANSRALVHQSRSRSSEERWDARRDLRNRSLKERRVTRSVENRPADHLERESMRQARQRSSSLNIKSESKDLSRLTSLRRVARVSRVSERSREERRSSAERMLSRIADQDRLSGKWERNLQNAGVDRNMDVRARIIPGSTKNDEFLKDPKTYDFVRQALVVALCTVYGLTLYNGKRSLIRSNAMQRVQRFMVW